MYQRCVSERADVDRHGLVLTNTRGTEDGSGTVGWLVDRWVAAKNDITEKSQMQNRWAAGHIRKALGAIRLDQLDRSDIARWYDELAAGGVLNKRSITIIRRVLRAALEDALDEGLIRRNPAELVPVPKRASGSCERSPTFTAMRRRRLGSDRRSARAVTGARNRARPSPSVTPCRGTRPSAARCSRCSAACTAPTTSPSPSSRTSTTA